MPPENTSFEVNLLSTDPAVYEESVRLLKLWISKNESESNPDFISHKLKRKTKTTSPYSVYDPENGKYSNFTLSNHARLFRLNENTWYVAHDVKKDPQTGQWVLVTEQDKKHIRRHIAQGGFSTIVMAAAEINKNPDGTLAVKIFKEDEQKILKIAKTKKEIGITREDIEREAKFSQRIFKDTPSDVGTVRTKHQHLEKGMLVLPLLPGKSINNFIYTREENLSSTPRTPRNVSSQSTSGSTTPRASSTSDSGSGAPVNTPSTPRGLPRQPLARTHSALRFMPVSLSPPPTMRTTPLVVRPLPIKTAEQSSASVPEKEPEKESITPAQPQAVAPTVESNLNPPPLAQEAVAISNTSPRETPTNSPRDGAGSTSGSESSAGPGSGGYDDEKGSGAGFGSGSGATSPANTPRGDAGSAATSPIHSPRDAGGSASGSESSAGPGSGGYDDEKGSGAGFGSGSGATSPANTPRSDAGSTATSPANTPRGDVGAAATSPIHSPRDGAGSASGSESSAGPGSGGYDDEKGSGAGFGTGSEDAELENMANLNLNVEPSPPPAAAEKTAPVPLNSPVSVRSSSNSSQSSNSSLQSSNSSLQSSNSSLQSSSSSIREEPDSLQKSPYTPHRSGLKTSLGSSGRPLIPALVRKTSISNLSGGPAATQPKSFEVSPKWQEQSLGTLVSEKILPFIAHVAAFHAYEKAIVHNDIKLENAQWDEKKKHLVLCDLGFAQEEGELINSPGDLKFAAPELLRLGKKSFLAYKEADIFSMTIAIGQLLGCTANVNGRYAAKDRMEMANVPIHFDELDKNVFNLPAEKLKEIKDMLNRGVHPDPSQRPSAEKMFNFFRKFCTEPEYAQFVERQIEMANTYFNDQHKEIFLSNITQFRLTESTEGKRQPGKKGFAP